MKDTPQRIAAMCTCRAVLWCPAMLASCNALPCHVVSCRVMLHVPCA